MSTEKKDILRLILLRLVVVTSLIVSALIIQFSTSAFLTLNQFYLILSFYLLSLLYIFLYILGKHYALQVSAQILFDLILITALVYISGGLQGFFYFLTTLSTIS